MDEWGDPVGWTPFVESMWVKYPNYFERVPYYKDGRLWVYIAGVHGMDQEDDTALEHKQLIEAVNAHIEDWSNAIAAFNNSAETAFERVTDYMSIYELLTSPCLFSGNVHSGSDRSDLSAVLAKIARIDRLPPENSIGGTRALVYAWDAVDVCNHVADTMKRLTKI